MEGHLIELMLGYRHDPLVGPTVLLSTGGIAAELMPDYAIRLAPVGLSEARAMIAEVKHSKLIPVFRGLLQGEVDGVAPCEYERRGGKELVRKCLTRRETSD